ncbi:MAG: EAL domain-containing protein [Pseudomonadota bacterium]
MDKQSGEFRILIVDDSPDIHTVFRQILSYQTQVEHEGAAILAELPTFAINYAFQGEEAVELVEQALAEGAPYALAFVDIRMPPGWDGMKTIQQIWELDKDIQMVICTGGSDYSWEDTIINLGGAFDNFLILKKPFDSMTVRQIACALTSKWQLARVARKHTENLEKQVAERTAQLQLQAAQDPLTKLPNRTSFIEHLYKLIHTPMQPTFSVFFFDLDRFKLINDSLTHAIGDQLLKLVAERLNLVVGLHEKIIARFGGDEFAIAVNNIKNPEEATHIAENFLNALAQPFYIGQRELLITSSLGISLYPQDGEDPESLCRNADTAMYKAKERGPNNFQFFEFRLNQNTLERLELENQLFRAIKNHEFILHYQPEFNLQTGKIEGVEALIRWQHPERGLIAPLEFIPVAEESGQILQIGEWVLRKACKQNKLWQDSGLPKFRIAVNIARHQIEQHEELVAIVQNSLEESGLAPQFLEIELSENIIIQSSEIIETVGALKNLGLSIALDDFGIGYSNLSYLKKLPIDRLKIDRVFTDNIDSDEDDEAIVRAILAVANSLDIGVIAEGIETRGQLNFLKKEGCHEGQGFYFCKPLPGRDFEEFLKKYEPGSIK